MSQRLEAMQHLRQADRLEDNVRVALLTALDHEETGLIDAFRLSVSMLENGRHT